MAQLIKLRTPPKQHIVKKWYKLLPFNQIIKHYRVKKVDLFDDLKTHIKKSINTYQEKKEDTLQKAKTRGENKYKSMLIIDIIIGVINYRTSLSQENEAIETLSHNIANIILNQPNISPKNHSLLPQKACFETLDLTAQLHVPYKRLEGLGKKYRHITNIFKPSEFFVPHSCDTGAQIWIQSVDASFSLNFDDRIIDTILHNVLKRI